MILFCRCAYADVLPASTRQQVEGFLEGSGLPFAAVDDLCGLAARRDELLARAAEAEDATIVACHPRAVRWLFHWAGFPLAAGKARILNMRTQSAEQIIADLPQREAGRKDHAPSAAARPADDEWVPWFPVIDYDRCADCKQCLNFCLFGVYAAEADGRVRVAAPAQCKLNCPACARLCPQVAIIFPKYPQGAISGDEVRDEDLQRSDLKVDVSKLSRGDLLDALRQRSRQP
ncbi:MAG TPA: ferredoxin family protein [Phycisphaerae bacterium]|nr:ferredoxin family protein [Phycisphaerae bacterium]HUT60929.1 ferredoxin family protein [Phycisphaerae bacterium]